MIEKRVSNILGSSSSVAKNMTKSSVTVSEPVKCVQKPWVPPMEKEVLEMKFSQEQLLVEARKK